MDKRSLLKHLYARLGILVFLVILEIISGILIENNYDKDGDFFLVTYSYMAFVFPMLFGFWFLWLLIETVILAFKKKSYLRTVNLIIILFTLFILFLAMLYFNNN